MPDLGPFKKAYRILSWVSLVGLIVVILLVLRTSPAPQVTNDPNAAARAEKKFEAADQAKAAGQPGQVALDGTELNSYLAQNLQLEGGAAPACHCGRWRKWRRRECRCSGRRSCFRERHVDRCGGSGPADTRPGAIVSKRRESGYGWRRRKGIRDF